MSAKNLRNLVSNQLEILIDRGKEKIKEEGKKKIAELKAQIPTPQTLMEMLKTEINGDSCSEAGNEKFMKIYNKIKDTLDKINNILGGGLETLEGVKGSIDPIIGEEGVVGQLNTMADNMKPITDALKIIILAAPVLLSANSGPTSSGAVTDQVSDKRDKAISKVMELAALVICIPLIIKFYINEAKKITMPLDVAIAKITFIKDEVSKLLLFLHALLLDKESQCAAYELGLIPDPPDPPDPPGPTDLEIYLANLQAQYDSVYQTLLNQGNTKAIERIFTINEDLLAIDYYISHKIINL